MRKTNVKPSSFKKTLPLIKKIQFTLLVLSATAYLIVRVYECFTTFFESETGTRTVYIPTSETPIPELSFCPADPYNLDNLIQNGIKSVNEYRFNSNWNSNNPGKSAIQLYKDVVIDVTKIVEKINVFLEHQYNGSNVLSFTSSNKKVCDNQSMFEIKEYYYNGDCLCLIMPECLSKSGVLEIALEFNINVHIFLYHKGKAKLKYNLQNNSILITSVLKNGTVYSLLFQNVPMP